MAPPRFDLLPFIHAMHIPIGECIMSESTLKPFTGKLDENNDTKQQPTLKPFTGALDGEKKGVMGHLKDTGISALKGAVAVPELAVGIIMDVMSDGATGKTLEETVGFRPKEAKTSQVIFTLINIKLNNKNLQMQVKMGVGQIRSLIKQKSFNKSLINS